MLTIKIANQKDMSNIQDLINNHHLDEINLEAMADHCMIAYDNEIPVAAAGYESFGSIGILRFVVVRRDRQREYLGDGILKAVLNLADKKGIRRMIVGTQQHGKFFKKVGFCKLNIQQHEDEAIKTFIEKNFRQDVSLWEAMLPDFFQKSCRSNQ
ncbi:GNAT family N-acetyltransferase [Thermotalea metallivorans]|uniref:N-acetyltransferase domain-containing protein n=1 Tax=Thermotalea metallivorans TaxID=520762 RepID=A0A140L8G7_9FIRM|nr:GNAT family N-acetyltransferase [Thermotalea metallivorans]KXG76842.1 hypothetical protein AN619_08340 [Thermotalea metallivorans]